jgi:hypothetical protein
MSDSNQVLLVLGNGFDKSLGLPTGYKDFIESEEFNKLYIDSLKIPVNTGLIRTLKEKADLNNWVDVELEIKNFAINLSKHSIDKYQAEKLKIEFESLKKGLCTYLKRCLSRATLNSQNSFSSFAQKFIGKKLNIISFNYTDVFAIAVKQMNLYFSELRSVFNIHGTLNDDNIIFGIDGTNSSSLNNQITFLEKEYSFNYNPTTAGRLFKYSEEIFFYGISLGETDRHYFEPFFHNLLSSQESNKVYFSFYEEESYQYLHNRLKEYTNNRMHSLKSRHRISFYDCVNEKYIE